MSDRLSQCGDSLAEFAGGLGLPGERGGRVLKDCEVFGTDRVQARGELVQGLRKPFQQAREGPDGVVDVRGIGVGVGAPGLLAEVADLVGGRDRDLVRRALGSMSLVGLGKSSLQVRAVGRTMSA
ncbi:hypothetical protein [Kitasatospora sp. MAP5-34]|uniref:hypothetical protein n=1 Tax=Kitasatospora sp. MAP5-34 TaxID=3035102 RepID=UPI0024747BA1|nr:hypothetical protein [Kitasatospora sp. MAP5-34]MDH6580500.1 hypothetical protein [Kitasatospora sp. MAP5-34]